MGATADKYKPILRDLYPPGAFQGATDPDGNATFFDDWCEADALALESAQDACDQLALEIFPQTADETLEEWEAFFEANPDPQASDATRRLEIQARARAAQPLTPHNIRNMVAEFLNPEHGFWDPCTDDVLGAHYDTVNNNGQMAESAVGLEMELVALADGTWDGTTWNAPVALVPLVDRVDFTIEGKVTGGTINSDTAAGLVLMESETSVYLFGRWDVAGTTRIRARKIEAGGAVINLGDIATIAPDFWLVIESTVEGVLTFKAGAALGALTTVAADVESTIRPRHFGVSCWNSGAFNAVNAFFQPLRIAYNKQIHNVEIHELEQRHVPVGYQEAIFSAFIHRDPGDAGDYNLTEPQRIVDRAKWGHTRIMVGESDNFLTDDEYSLTDRDILGK